MCVCSILSLMNKLNLLIFFAMSDMFVVYNVYALQSHFDFQIKIMKKISFSIQVNQWKMKYSNLYTNLRTKIEKKDGYTINSMHETKNELKIKSLYNWNHKHFMAHIISKWKIESFNDFSVLSFFLSVSVSGHIYVTVCPCFFVSFGACMYIVIVAVELWVFCCVIWCIRKSRRWCRNTYWNYD